MQQFPDLRYITWLDVGCMSVRAHWWMWFLHICRINLTEIHNCDVILPPQLVSNLLLYS